MNMRVRVMACLAILSVLLSVIIFSEFIRKMPHDPEYTSYDSGIASTTGVYFMENWNERGRLYLLDDKGNVLEMQNSGAVEMRSIEAIEIANESVYAVYSSTRNVAGEVYNVYVTASYTPSLELVSQTDPFMLDTSEEVRDLFSDGDNMYITTLNADGNSIKVYSMPMSELIDISERDDGAGPLMGGDGSGDTAEAGELKTPDVLLFRESPAGRIYADAYYDGTNVIIRTDADQPEGYFAPDLRVKTAVDSMHFNLVQQIILYANYVAWWAGGLIIWFILAGIMYAGIRMRSRAVYVCITSELMYMIILIIAFEFVRDEYAISERRQNIRYAELEMHEELDGLADLDTLQFGAENFYDSDSYMKLISSLRSILKNGDNDAIYYDVFVLHLRSGLIVADGRGVNLQDASFVYGSALSGLQGTLMGGEVSAGVPFAIGDIKTTAVGVKGDDPTAGFALVAICYDHSGSTGFWANFRQVFMLFILVFLLGSFIMLFILYLQAMDLKRFEEALRNAALGRKNINIPGSSAMDMKSMWNSLSELLKRMEEINYEKYMIFEGYYRFAPKNIEKIMGKDSIFEVQNGDITRVSGTLMLFSTDSREGDFSDKRVKSLVNIISFMDHFSEKEDGILVSQDSALSVLQFLFLDKERHTTATATQFLHRNSSDRGSDFVSGFLYYDDFIYGVAGTRTQCLSFLTSVHTKEMESYAVWFKDLGIPLVITESVAKREDTGQIRYIGFIILDSDGRKIRLYEVIDASPAKIRQLKLMYKNKFEETLELFYSKEYYLARNQFSEILKECPEDTLAKWYLFESERYLNGELAPSDGELRISE
ncbi:MAG: hypothetical protein J5966_02850 [Lachnospiraceae bacterium]|nr:hypothetical protein [Lachnospiraceae bacterium]